MAGAKDSRFIAYGLAELIKGLDVALPRKEHPSPAVVPDRPRGVVPVARFDLSEVVKAQQELDALARTARCVAGEPRDPGEICSLVQSQQQTRVQHPALRPRPSRRQAEQRQQ